MPSSSPPIAGPPYEDVAGRTERLARALSPWKPPEDGGPDLGRALIQVFDRMARHVLERLNRVPDRDFLAYLNLIGIEPAPPRAARVPLTFSLVERSTAEPTIPAGTRVGATPAPDDTRAIVFETERELATTRTRLKAAFIRAPDGDRWADRTAQATGQAPGFYEAFTGTQPVEHAFFLAMDDLSPVPVGAEFTATFTFASQPERDAWSKLHGSALPLLADDAYYKEHPPEAPLVRWSYWNGARWSPLEPTLNDSGEKEWQLTFKVPSDLAAVKIRNRTARWLRADLTAWPDDALPEVRSLTLKAKVQSPALAPELALTNARPVDLSMDFQPLGERPRLNDTFYVASAPTLSRPGATVTVKVESSAQAAQQLKTQDPPTLVWEVSTDKGWKEVARSSAEAAAPPNDALPTQSFTLPMNVAPAVVHGKRAHWLRIRLVSGDFGKGPRIDDGKVVDEGFQPPVLVSLTLTVDALEISTSPPAPLRRGDFTFTELPPGEPFVPFLRDTTAAPALYLGFHQPFANRETPLYVQVAPLTADEAGREVDPEALPPRIVWEYATAMGWAPLGAEDETRALSRSGLVRFLGPGDFAARTEFGSGPLYWFRARLDAGTFAVMPRLGRVLTNTVWARHASTLTGEVLGSSDGGTEQVFTLSQRPVLVGQRIEVREPEQPSDAERAELERVEGKDAVQVTRAPGQPAEIWVRWHEVPDFHASGLTDRHYTLDRQTGEVRFGDGRYGKVPPRGVRNVRAALYRTGGGTDGNRPVGAVSQLKTAVAYVDAVTNLEPASGGADRESEGQARTRGPRMLRHGGRAVTADDFEDLAREASPAVARVKALTASFDPLDLVDTPGSLPGVTNVVVLIVPISPERPPVPGAGLLQDVRAHLETRCAPALSLRVVGPDWLEVSTAVTLVPTSFEGAEALRAEVQRALTDFLHPLTGGFEGTGWELGELPQESDLYRLVAGLPGVESVRTASLPPTKPERPERTLIYSGTHTVFIVPPGGA